MKGAGNGAVVGGAKTVPAEVKVKIKGDAEKKVRSATRAGSRWKKKAEEKVKAIIEKDAKPKLEAEKPAEAAAKPAPSATEAAPKQ